MSIKLLHNLVGVRKIESPKTSKSGIILSDDTKDTDIYEVTHLSDEIMNLKTIKIGDKVLVSGYFNGKIDNEDGTESHITTIGDIYSIVET